MRARITVAKKYFFFTLNELIDYIIHINIIFSYIIKQEKETEN